MSARGSIVVTVCAASVLVSGCASNEPNPGPCPRAYALYDVSRMVDFKDGVEAFSAVGYTAEIQNVETLCRYSGDRPIEASLDVEIGFGRGPAAEGDTYEYRYFVAVTRRDSAVIAKETYPVRVKFPRGEDRVFRRESIDRITIPRRDEDVSGTNFEILVGLEVTPQQLEYNRLGKRFTSGVGG